MKTKVRVHPSSKKPSVKADSLGVLHIFVNEPAQDGKANTAVRGALAKHLKIAKSRVLLIKGHKSRNKTFLIKFLV